MRRGMLTSFRMVSAGLLGLVGLMFACGDDGKTGVDGGSTVAPTVVSNTPANGANGVPLNGNASATFSEAMDPASLTATTFTLTSGAGAVPVLGTVIYADGTAVFWPAAHLAASGSFTATVTTGSRNLAGTALASKQVWTFNTGTTLAPGLPVNLGAAGSFAILAKSAISTVPPSVITGDLGLSPAAATFVTGFSLSLDATNVFSSSTQVTGKIYAATYAVPTPAKMTAAIGAMELAFVDAAGRAPDVTELGAGNIGGMTLAPGVYKWGTGLAIPTDVTLTGSATDVWIFQISQDLVMSSGAKVLLAGGARAKNVFWQVAGLVNLNTTAHCEGVILTKTAITLHTGASIVGRLFAQTAVSLDASTVVQPAP